MKCSEREMFLAFSLANVLLATTACTFSTSHLPKVVREWCVLHILTSKCASRHNGVHFFDISTFKSGPRTVCFVHFDFEMCFAPFRATTACNFSSLIWPDGSAPTALANLLFDLRSHKSLEKHSVLRLLYFFAHLHLLSSDSFSSLIFSLYSSLLSDSSHLCFSSVHIVGSLTSKLPSIRVPFYGYITVYPPFSERPGTILTAVERLLEAPDKVSGLNPPLHCSVST